MSITSLRRRNTVPGTPPIPLMRSVRRFTERLTPVTADAILTAKSEPVPETAERTTERKNLSLLSEAERMIIPLITRNKKIM